MNLKFLAPLLLIPSLSYATMFANIETPIKNETVTGVGYLRGWTFSDKDQFNYYYSIVIDGEEFTRNSVTGFKRIDVYQNFKDQENVERRYSVYSGFAHKVDWNSFGPGEHNLSYNFCDTDGCLSGSYKFYTEQFDNTDKLDQEDIDLSVSSPYLDGNTIKVDRVYVSDIQYNVDLEWDENTQNFSIVNVEKDEPSFSPGKPTPQPTPEEPVFGPGGGDVDEPTEPETPTVNYSVDNYGIDTENEFLDLINNLRVNGGAPCTSASNLPRVSYDENLTNAALNHSADMAANNYFSHTGLNGSQFWERTASAGFTGQALAENIAAGNSSIQKTFNQWVQSSGHCTNMMNANATKIGYGWAMKNGSEWGYYHTLILGR